MKIALILCGLAILSVSVIAVDIGFCPPVESDTANREIGMDIANMGSGYGMVSSSQDSSATTSKAGNITSALKAWFNGGLGEFGYDTRSTESYSGGEARLGSTRDISYVGSSAMGGERILVDGAGSDLGGSSRATSESQYTIYSGRVKSQLGALVGVPTNPIGYEVSHDISVEGVDGGYAEANVWAGAHIVDKTKDENIDSVDAISYLGVVKMNRSVKISSKPLVTVSRTKADPTAPRMDSKVVNFTPTQTVKPTKKPTVYTD